MAIVVLLKILVGMICIKGPSTVSCQPTISEDQACGADSDAVESLTSQLSQLQRECERSERKNETKERRCPAQNLTISLPSTADMHAQALISQCIPLLIQQNVNGSNAFNRSWSEFKAGFNDSAGNYWLGTELMHQLTMTGRYKLRLDLHARGQPNTWLWAEYSTFIVQGEDQGYRLLISGFTGNAGQNALDEQSGMKFTTYDRDNDLWDGSQTGVPYDHNCAIWNSAGFWYKHCSLCDVNGYRGSGAFGFRWVGLNAQGDNRLERSRMWLTCR